MARLRTDWVLFITILAMTGMGLAMVYSASVPIAEIKRGLAPFSFAWKQLLFIVVSFMLLMILKRLDYRKMNSPIWAFSWLGFVIAALIVVYFIGSQHRWIRLGPFGLQPSEFAKPAMAVFLAYFVSRRGSTLNESRTLLQGGLAVAMLTLLVIVADFGTALVPLFTAAIIFWIAGLSRRYIAAGIVACIFLAIVSICSRGYRLGRVIAFVDPEYRIIETIDTGHRVRSFVQASTTVADQTYQGRQSMIAIGTGGVFGVGITRGKQSLLFLPEVHTDFIYAAVGEELGLWGASAVLFGFLIILWRGARLFLRAHDDFARYLALGCTLSIVIQAMINITVALKMVPTKGFPLPLFSYGGSSMVATMILLGMLLSVAEREA